jgi:integrase
MHIFENASSRAHGFDFEDWEDPQFNREMLYNLVRFLWCTGLRVAEVKRLKVKHVVLNPTKRGKVIYAPKADVTTLGYLLEDVNEAMVESVSQAIAMKDPDAEQYNYQFKFRIDWVKHKRHRRVVTPRLPIYNVMHRHLEQLERMFAAPRRGHRRINDHKDVTKILNALPPELPLFPSESGGPFSTMSRMHDVLLRNTFCDGRATSYSVDGRKMSLSCWRHTYATDLLNDFIERERPNLVEFLARNMGTSTAMIERHYGHILAQAADSDLMV